MLIRCPAIQLSNPNSSTSLAPSYILKQPPTMVCAKCQKLTKPTSLATPGVKKKSEMYYGSPAGTKTSSSSGVGKSPSATLGQTGIGKVSPSPPIPSRPIIKTNHTLTHTP